MDRENSIKISLVVLFMSLLLPPAAQARPVSYAGGWMAMTMNDPDTNSAMLLYSPTAWLALGPFVEHYRDTDGELSGLQVNWLAKRWNLPDSQGNFYVLSGLGVANDDSHMNPGGYLGIEADWEDRRYFVSYENRYTAAGDDVRDEYRQKARVGIAPYVAEAGALHTWLMLQAEHMPESDDKFTVTPLVRLFKGAYLGEAGISNRGEFLFNFTATF